MENQLFQAGRKNSNLKKKLIIEITCFLIGKTSALATSFYQYLVLFDTL